MMVPGAIRPIVLVALLLPARLPAGEPRIEANRTIVLAFGASRAQAEPWKVRLDAIVTAPGGAKFRVRGF